VRPRLLLPKFLMDFVPTDPVNVKNVKFVAVHVPVIIGGTQKYRQYLDAPTLPFLRNFNGLLFGWTL